MRSETISIWIDDIAASASTGAAPPLQSPPLSRKRAHATINTNAWDALHDDDVGDNDGLNNDLARAISKRQRLAPLSGRNLNARRVDTSNDTMAPRRREPCTGDTMSGSGSPQRNARRSPRRQFKPSPEKHDRSGDGSGGDDDDGSVDDKSRTTSRRSRALNAPAATTMLDHNTIPRLTSYSQSLSFGGKQDHGGDVEGEDEDEEEDDEGIHNNGGVLERSQEGRTLRKAPSLSSRSQTTNQTGRSSSPKKTTDLWNVGGGIRYTTLEGQEEGENWLGEQGRRLRETLQETMVNSEAIFPALLPSLPPLLRHPIGRTYPHHFDQDDVRDTQRLLLERHELASIVESTRICAEDCDAESEWNVRVHGRVLELAFPRSTEHQARFKTITSAKINPAYQPTNSPSILTGTAHRIVDSAIFLGPGNASLRSDESSLTQRVLALLNRKSGGGRVSSINHFDITSVQHSPLAISVETKTEGRTLDEAKAQLGVWVAAHVARLEALIPEMDISSTPRAEAQHGTVVPETTGASGHHQQADTISATPRPHQHSTLTRPEPSQTLRLLGQLIIPLICVHAKHWTLYLARATPMTKSNTRRPAAVITIAEPGELGSTTTLREVYQLVKALRVLKAWLDSEVRRWWEDFLWSLGV